MPKRLCITGASGGLGLSLCKLFIEKEIDVLAIARNRQDLLSLQKQYPSISIFPCDLTTHVDEAALAIQKFRADGLINNAGLGYYGPFHTLQQKEIEETLFLKIGAVTSLLRALIPFWIEEKIPATIVNISSASAFLPYPHFATYSAANRFLLHFSLSLQGELSPHHIASLCFCPGSIKTPFARKASHGHYTEDPPLALCPNRCAKAIYRQMQKQKSVLLYDLRYRLLITALNTLPKRLRSFLLIKSLRGRL